jgi:hypothetical protein
MAEIVVDGGGDQRGRVYTYKSKITLIDLDEEED